MGRGDGKDNIVVDDSMAGVGRSQAQATHVSSEFFEENPWQFGTSPQDRQEMTKHVVRSINTAVKKTRGGRSDEELVARKAVRELIDDNDLLMSNVFTNNMYKTGTSSAVMETRGYQDALLHMHDKALSNINNPMRKASRRKNSQMAKIIREILKNPVFSFSNTRNSNLFERTYDSILTSNPTVARMLNGLPDGLRDSFLREREALRNSNQSRIKDETNKALIDSCPADGFLKQPEWLMDNQARRAELETAKNLKENLRAYKFILSSSKEKAISVANDFDSNMTEQQFNNNVKTMYDASTGNSYEATEYRRLGDVDNKIKRIPAVVSESENVRAVDYDAIKRETAEHLRGTPQKSIDSKIDRMLKRKDSLSGWKVMGDTMGIEDKDLIKIVKAACYDNWAS